MIEISEEWCMNMARREDDSEIGAGLLARGPAFECRIALSDIKMGTDWQPAETAPTTCHPFDAWCVHPTLGGRGVRIPDVQMRGDGSGFGFITHEAKGPVWHYLDKGDEVFPPWKMTHWMPRPDGPRSMKERTVTYDRHTQTVPAFGHDILTKRPISHDEAREAMQRLVNSHFNNPGEQGRMSIPANPDRDDDLVLAAYIEQQRVKDSARS